MELVLANYCLNLFFQSCPDRQGKRRAPSLVFVCLLGYNVCPHFGFLFVRWVTLCVCTLCFCSFGRRPLIEDDLWWRTTFGKTTFDGGRPLMADHLWCKMTFDGTLPLMKDEQKIKCIKNKKHAQAGVAYSACTIPLCGIFGSSVQNNRWILIKRKIAEIPA